MTTDSIIKWGKKGNNDWCAEINGKTCWVHRVISKRSWSTPRKFGFGPSPRHSTSHAVVWAVVRVGNEWHRLVRPEGVSVYTVTNAKAAAARYAATGEGNVTITAVDE